MVQANHRVLRLDNRPRMLRSRQLIQQALAPVVVMYVSASDNIPFSIVVEIVPVQPDLVVLERNKIVVPLVCRLSQRAKISTICISLPSLVLEKFLKLACHQKDIAVVQQKR